MHGISNNRIFAHLNDARELQTDINQIESLGFNLRFLSADGAEVYHGNKRLGDVSNVAELKILLWGIRLGADATMPASTGT